MSLWYVVVVVLARHDLPLSNTFGVYDNGMGPAAFKTGKGSTCLLYHYCTFLCERVSKHASMDRWWLAESGVNSSLGWSAVPDTAHSSEPNAARCCAPESQGRSARSFSSHSSEAVGRITPTPASPTAGFCMQQRSAISGGRATALFIFCQVF